MMRRDSPLFFPLFDRACKRISFQIAGLVLFSCLAHSSIYAQQWNIEDVEICSTFEELEPILEMNNDTTYLINFWATWCGPCVKELPYFEALVDTYADKKFKLVLVSLDFESKLDSKLIPFLNKHQIRGEVIVLLDGKAHKWIDKVDPSWSGAIPITLIRSGKEKRFYEKVFHSEAELKELVSPFLN